MGKAKWGASNGWEMQNIKMVTRFKGKMLHFVIAIKWEVITF